MGHLWTDTKSNAALRLGPGDLKAVHMDSAGGFPIFQGQALAIPLDRRVHSESPVIIGRAPL